MAQEIRIKHEVDVGSLERFEKALKKVTTAGEASKITQELKKQYAQQQKINQSQKSAEGIVGKLVKRQKELKRAQLEEKDVNKLKKINKELRGVRDNLKKAKDTQSTWGKAMGSFAFKFNTLANIASQALSKISQALNKLGKESIKTFMDFEHQMDAVRAIAEATSEQFEKLRNDAIRLGGSTIFTATQVGKLQEQYAKLGFTTKEIINATEATLALAAATGEDLATSAMVAGNTLRAFRMEADETWRVVNVMAKSFTSSALDLYHFQESMRYIAPVAQKLGWELEDVTATMAALADTGLKGSMAGTALRRILLLLADESSKLQEFLGGNVETFSEFLDGMERARAAGADLNDMLNATNLRAVTAGSSIQNLTDRIEELKEKFYDTEAAQRMATIRMDNLKGAVTILRSAWEGLILTIENGEGVIGTTLKNITFWVTDLLIKIKEETGGSTEGLREIRKEMEKNYDVYVKETALRKKMDELGIEAPKDRIKWLQKMQKTFEESYKSQKEKGQELYNLYKTEGVEAWRTQAKILGLYKEDVDEFFETETQEFNIIMERYIKRYKDVENFAIAASQRIARENVRLTGKGLEETKEDAFRIYKKIEQFRIGIMEEGLEKELATLELSYKEQLKLAKEYGIDRSHVDEWYVRKRTQIYDDANEQILNDMEDWLDEDYKKNIEQLKKEQDIAVKRAELEGKTQEEIDAILIEHLNKRIRYLEQFGDKYEDIILGLKLQIKGIEEEGDELGKWNEKVIEVLEERIEYLEQFGDEYAEKIEKLKKRIENVAKQEGPVNAILAGLGIDDPDKFKTELKQFTDEALRAIGNYYREQEKIIDNYLSKLDEKISAQELAVQVEAEMAAANKANTLKYEQEKLDELREKREQAMAEKEKVMAKERRIQTATQALNIATSVSQLISSITKTAGPLALLLIPGAVAGLFAIWSSSVDKIEDKLPKFAKGGEIDGPSHDRGGVLLEAEGGEYIVKKDSYRKYPDLIEAINRDNQMDVWSELNQGDKETNINLNNKKTEELLSKLVDLTEQTPKDFGSYIEYVHNGTKYRIRKS